MQLISFLILFPLLIAFVLLIFRNDHVRALIIKVSAILLSIGAIALLIKSFHQDVQYFSLKFGSMDLILFAIEILLSLYILYLTIKFRKWRIMAMIITQNLIMTAFRIKFGGTIPVTHTFFVDKLSILMAMIVGIVGGLIAIYSIGYMRDYQAMYKDVKDRRPFFFFVIFVFFSAMFTLVFSNNLFWIYFCWEITTLSSFFLIGYSQKGKAIPNSFCALEYNLWGGITIALAIFYLYSTTGTVELDKLMHMGKGAAMIPVALICIAGISKTAQYPFSKWLLGAMVAPTPVSALLHSSTMVKAGVYIILRFTYILEGTLTGYLVAAVGGITFLIGSMTAISQDDAKKVLAYSTIANLGLIILCAGIGSYEALWAGALLIIFHAVTKCLLFLCVGIIDDKTHSRNIEDMCGLIISMPKISIMMQIGIAGMFLAPFGMLISKWAVIRALLDSNPMLIACIAFGGAATIFYWVKWMGKLTLVERPERGMEKGIPNNIWVPLFTLSGLTILLVALLPWVSKYIVDPYIIEIYGHADTMDHGNIIVMSIMLALLLLFPLSFIHQSKSVRVTKPYLSGANTGEYDEFIGAMGTVKAMDMKDYYLEKYFGEGKLFRIGVIISLFLIAGFIAASIFVR